MLLSELFEKCHLDQYTIQIAENFGLPSELLGAFIVTESSGRKYALRFEKNYKWLHYPEHFAKIQGITVDTETALQKFSFGYTQIMGATARYLGYEGNLMYLFNPRTNVEWCANYFNHLYDKYGDLVDAVSAYNQGSPRKNLLNGKYKNQGYVDKVLRQARQFGIEI